MWISEPVRNVRLKNHTFRTFVTNPLDHIHQKEKIASKAFKACLNRWSHSRLDIASMDVESEAWVPFTRDRTKPCSNSSSYSYSHEAGRITNQKGLTQDRTNSYPKSSWFTSAIFGQSVQLNNLNLLVVDISDVFLDPEISLPYAKRRFVLVHYGRWFRQDNSC